MTASVRVSFRSIEASVADDSTFPESTVLELAFLDDQTYDQRAKNRSKDRADCNAGFRANRKTALLRFQSILKCVELTRNDNTDRSSLTHSCYARSR